MTAGVHIYAEKDTATYINALVAGVYNTKAPVTPITLKRDGTYLEIFSGKRYQSENGTVLLPTGKEPAHMLILEEMPENG